MSPAEAGFFKRFKRRYLKPWLRTNCGGIEVSLVVYLDAAAVRPQPRLKIAPLESFEKTGFSRAILLPALMRIHLTFRAYPQAKASGARRLMERDNHAA